MNPDVKKKWVAALRSGEYRQGTGRLRSKDDRFCCLGVLCDLAVRADVLGAPERGDGYYLYGDEYRVSGSLPREVQAWAETDSACGRLNVEVRGFRYLDSLNDGGATFEEIADVIEAQL